MPGTELVSAMINCMINPPNRTSPLPPGGEGGELSRKDQDRKRDDQGQDDRAAGQPEAHDGEELTEIECTGHTGASLEKVDFYT
jgi:hypothetical protein